MTARSSVPVVRSSAPDRHRRGRRRGGRRAVAYRKTGRRDPAVPPLVLVLDVGRVRPLDDAQASACWRRAGGGPVRSNSDARCESLPTPISSPLRLDDQDALGGTDVEHDPPSGPARGDLELALVDAGRVRLRDLGRQARERHLDVRVVGRVPGAGHRPEARDVGLAPVGTGRRRRAIGSSWKRQRPSSGRRSPWTTLCMGSRPIPVSSGWFHGPVTSTIVARSVRLGSVTDARPRRCSARPAWAVGSGRCGRSAGWISRCRAARSSACSDRTARARPRPSGC